ncbi:MAG: TRAP transporter large permease subunit [Alphaproteobacteria bacterium]|nr:TRAP transporter large permease subunit [Alphaproteobacteria bacterium]
MEMLAGTWEWFIEDHLYEYIGAYMFLALALALFTGLPVAFALGGIALIFALIGTWIDSISFKEFFNAVNRSYGGDGQSGAIQNPILVAIPCFVFMGTMLERSNVAAHLLHILQIMLKRVPGGLALSVTVMGTIMAATTGIIGASVVMMTLLALPTMLKRGYYPPLATGTNAASATLGILIPTSIMLVLMANLLAVSVGNLFVGAVLPGLVLSGLYIVYITTRATISPSLAPPIREDEIDLQPSRLWVISRFLLLCAAILGGAWMAEKVELTDQVNWPLMAFLGVFIVSMVVGRREGENLFGGILRGFVPPIFLIVLVLGSIFAGWATPTEAAGVGAFGSLVLAYMNGTLTWQVVREVCHRTGLTTAMIFFIFIGATAFSSIFRAVYGEDLIIEFIEWLDLGPWALLFLLMFAVFLLGFFFDFLEITLIILPVFAPVIRAFAPAFAAHLGYDVSEGMNQAERDFIEAQVIYWFAILVAVNLQTSFLTPPFGFALFYMKGVAPSTVKMQEIYYGIIPFVTLQVIGIMIVLYLPELALWLPVEAGLAKVPLSLQGGG